MRSINKVIIIGNLTRDPELRQTPSGQNVCTFGIATNREWVTKDNDKKNSAEFHECVAWAHLAEICANHLKKGNLVYVEGYLKTRNWDTPEGIKKFKTEIVVQDLIFLEKRGNDDRTNTPEEKKEEKPVKDDEVKKDKEEETAEEKKEQPKEEPKPEPKSDPKPEPTPETDEEENPIDKDLGL